MERCDGQSTFADRQGGLRRSSRRRGRSPVGAYATTGAAHAATRLQAAAVVGPIGACDHDRPSPTSVISSEAEKSHVVEIGDPSTSSG
jgi:hypothetical protein